MLIFKKIFTDNKGLSLTELLVSVSIIIILSTVTFANIRQFSTSGDINMTAQRLVSDIREAQSNALGLKKFNDKVPPGGWGVYFDVNSTNYFIYADISDPANYLYDSDSDPAKDEKWRTVDFPQGFKIEDV
ncbi:Tfp pilus assembly protein FimT/FimU, partial [Patescibacteria group bacterium]